MCVEIVFHTCLYTVIKAERVSNDSVNKDYVFPDEDDNLKSYTGGIAQLNVPSGLLQNISKCIYCIIEQVLYKVIVIIFTVYISYIFIPALKLSIVIVHKI